VSTFLLFDPSVKLSEVFIVLLILWFFKNDCQFGSSLNDVFIYCRLCNIVIHPKCTGLVGRVKDYIDLRVGFSWTCASCVEIDRDLDGYVALTNDRFMKLFDKLMSVVANFKESVGSPKRKKTAPSKSAPVKASVPNPNLASNIFTRSIRAGGPKSSLQPKGSNTTQLSVPTGEVSSKESLVSIIRRTMYRLLVADEGDYRLFHIGSNYLCLV